MKRILFTILMLILSMSTVSAEDVPVNPPDESAQENISIEVVQDAPAEPTSNVEYYEGKVTRVLSADTIEIDGERLHLLGIYSPQKWWWGKFKECYSVEAAKYVEDLMLDQTVVYSFDRAQKRRNKVTLYSVYVYKDDLFVNADLVSKGYAFADQTRQYSERDNLIKLEGDAKLHSLGFWHRCPVVCYTKTLCRTKNW